MSEANPQGPLDLNALRQKISSGEIDTIIVVFPDTYGRLVGKRLAGRFFLEQCAEAGTHSCNYLLTVNMEMEPLEGFKLASWEKGYGDLGVKPALSSLRLIPWQKTSALVICDLQDDDGNAVAEAPRSVLRKQLQRLSA